MPRLKTCKIKIGQAEFSAPLNVSTRGEFSINRPEGLPEWTGPDRFTGKTADEVENQWATAVREYVARSKRERKVIAVIFDSTVRESGKRSPFTDQRTMLMLQCLVALETTIETSGKTEISYKEHPDYTQMHGPRQPFGCLFEMHDWEISHRKEICTIVEWSQEVEDMLVRACRGIEAIAEMLSAITASPEALKDAMGLKLEFNAGKTTTDQRP